MPCHILFVGSRDASLSAMAAACARPLAGKAHTVSFAAVGSGEPHPAVKALLSEASPEANSLKPLALANLRTPVDLAVAMDSTAAEQCPPLPGNPCFLNWNLWEPATSGPEAAVKDNFRSVRDAIRRLTVDLFERGYLSALAQCRNRFEVVFDNISDGIIGHDLKRIITHFNRAAERITGYSRAEVINRDCHSVFPGNFCGGKCKYCDGSPAAAKEDDEELTLTTKAGESRRIHMTRRFMLDTDGKRVGVLASFRDLTRELELERKAGKAWSFSGIIGRDRKMLEVFDLIKELADSSVPVLIEGESGTGKELVAAAIHNEGPRAGKLFVPVNCGALPESLLESELFGHVKGAFTGAIRDKKGRFELADGGTIFLDEIGDISPAMQVKLLRVLQEGSFERVGGEQTIRVNVRVISATNKNIAQEIAENRFRQDLFYRLSVVPLALPPLRERRNDIPLIVDHILKGIIEDRGKPVGVSPEAMDLLMSHSWPGNVRELQNWLQFAMIKCRGDTILPQHLPPPRPTHATVLAPSFAARHLDMEAVRSALEKTGGNKVEAARVLGVSRATLYRFLDANEPDAPGEGK
jgi:PAS domain S-box-containing protein